MIDEKDKRVDCILNKAFDKVLLKRLIWKLEHTGDIKGKLLTWMRDYLVDKEMRTTIKNVNSNLCYVSNTVPQRSVLISIMFIIIYIWHY